MLFYLFFLFFFFFSSRRRHTRLVSDWSSDVCSSDLLSFTPTWSGRSRRSYGASDLLLPKPKRQQIPRERSPFSLLLVAAFHYGSDLRRAHSCAKRAAARDTVYKRHCSGGHQVCTFPRQRWNSHQSRNLWPRRLCRGFR